MNIYLVSANYKRIPLKIWLYFFPCSLFIFRLSAISWFLKFFVISDTSLQNAIETQAAVERSFEIKARSAEGNSPKLDWSISLSNDKRTTRCIINLTAV